MLQNLNRQDYDKLDEVSKLRLDKVLAIIEARKMRFPNAEIAAKVGKGKSEVSVYLRAKKPMSANFYETFLKHFPIPQEKAPINIDATIKQEIGKLMEISVNQQAAINLLLKAFGSVSTEEIEKEANRLFAELGK